MFDLPITSFKFYLIILFYFILTIALVNVGHKYDLGYSNGVLLGLIISGGLWYFVGEKYVTLN